MHKVSMEGHTETETKTVLVGGSKTATFLAKRHLSRKTTLVIAALAVVLLLGAVALSAMFLCRTRLEGYYSVVVAEVKLEQGETLMYRVEQMIEMRGGDVHEGTITALVGIHVLNKTTEEYWFLMKINITVEGDSVGDMGGVKSGIMDFFLVKLKVNPGRNSTKIQGSNKTYESFELYGHQNTDVDFLRYVYSIISQLLPTLKRDVYEDVDGERVTSDHQLNPEESPLYPGAVRMHRTANTSDKNTVLIRNNFNRSDLENASSEIDLEMTYSDMTFINKSNGMVTESRAYLSEQLNFGEPIHSKGGFDVTAMNVTLKSNITRIETNSTANHFTQDEIAAVDIHVFVKLFLPKSNTHFILKERKVEPLKEFSNSSATYFSDPYCFDNMTSPQAPVKRKRRSWYTRNGWNALNQRSLRTAIRKTPTLFEKKVIGINLKGETNVWLVPKHRHSFEVGVGFSLRFGSLSVQLFRDSFDDKQIKRSTGIRIRKKWEKKFGIEVQVYFLRLGVEFSLWVPVDITLRFPHRENSLSPLRMALEIEPSVAVTTSLAGYVSAYVLRAGVYGDGTLVRGSLPLKLSYRADRYAGRNWCLALSARVTAIELEAGIFYQWISCRWRWFWITCDWGDRNTLYRFGKWAAFSFRKNLFETCF